MGKKDSSTDTGSHNPVNWDRVFQVAAGATAGASSAYLAGEATDSAAQVAVTNWPLILGLGAAGIGIAIYLKKK